MTFKPAFEKSDVVYLIPKDEILSIFETYKDEWTWSPEDIEEFMRLSCFGEPIRINRVLEDKWGAYYDTKETNPWKIRDWMLVITSCDIANEDEYASIFS